MTTNLSSLDCISVNKITHLLILIFFWFQNSPTDQLRRKIPHGSVRPDTTYDLDDVMSTMSETDANDTGQFSRGNRLRSSLPIVRSPNKSLDKALGEWASCDYCHVTAKLSLFSVVQLRTGQSEKADPRSL